METVKDILTESRSIASTVLGPTYQRLAFIYDVTKLHERQARLAFGFRPLGAVPVPSVTKSITQDQEFELILTDTFGRGVTDEQREAALDVMYDKQDDIMAQMMLTKINLASVVISVTQPSISEPEFVDDNKLIVLRTQYIVKYRRLL